MITSTVFNAISNSDSLVNDMVSIEFVQSEDTVRYPFIKITHNIILAAASFFFFSILFITEQ